MSGWSLVSAWACLLCSVVISYSKADTNTEQAIFIAAALVILGLHQKKESKP